LKQHYFSTSEKWLRVFTKLINELKVTERLTGIG
jgi:hypothetical protein